DRVGLLDVAEDDPKRTTAEASLIVRAADRERGRVLAGFLGRERAVHQAPDDDPIPVQLGAQEEVLGEGALATRLGLHAAAEAVVTADRAVSKRGLAARGVAVGARDAAERGRREERRGGNQERTLRAGRRHRARLLPREARRTEWRRPGTALRRSARPRRRARPPPRRRRR